MDDSRWIRWLDTLAPRVCAALGLLLALVVLLGWVLHQPLLVQVNPRWAPMQVNTALGLLAGHAALALHLAGRRRAALVAAAVPVLLGAATLLETYGQVNLYIDDLLIQPFTMVRTEFPGRMSVNSAITFCLAGSALWLLAWGPQRRFGHLLAALLGTTLVALAANALFGYIARIELAYAWTGHSQMAVHTASGFLLLGLGATVRIWSESRDVLGDSPAWSVIPVFVGCTIVSIGVWQTLLEHDRAQALQVLQAESHSVAHSLRSQALDYIRGLQRMAGRAGLRPHQSRQDWEADALNFLHFQPDYESLEFIDEWGVIKWVVPRIGNKELIGMVAAHDPVRRQAIDTVWFGATAVITPRVVLVQGGEGLIIYAPIPGQGGFHGMIAGAIRYGEMFSQTLMDAELRGIEFALIEDAVVVLRSSSPRSDEQRRFIQTQAIAVGGRQWTVRVWPNASRAALLRNDVPDFALGLGLLLSLLLSVTLHVGRHNRLQGRALVAANEQLIDEITERNVIQEELSRSNSALQAVNHELEAFAYSVSHDLRQPLRAMIGFAQIVKEDYGDKLDATGKDALNRIQAGAQRMGELIDALLRLSRITRAKISQDPVDLTNLAREIAAQLDATEPERQLEWRIAEGMQTRGDANLLRAMLENLLGNAWKFTAHTPEARIEVGRSGENGSSTFFVRDNGAGFDMAYAGKLFGAFQRLHANTEFPGTGIGLATVQRIVHRHGGRISAEGAVGKGATFQFTL